MPIWATILGDAPRLLWPGVALYALLRFGAPIVDDVIPRLARVRGFGVEVEFTAALEQIGRRKNLTITTSQLVKRVQRDGMLMRGASLLWVDDNPDSIQLEVDVFKALGASVTIVMDSHSGLASLRARSYDAVISDMQRGEDATAGITFTADVLRGIAGPPLAILYTGQVRRNERTPLGAFAITDRPDDLLNLVFDVLERTRG